jgi:hypothetical protein
VEEGVPVILHRVCFSIPYGESITIKEDPVTDLTTSINLTNGLFKTEYPDYTEFKIRRDRPDVSRPLWLDFKAIPAGDFVAQLDWSTSKEVNNSHFVIERSIDGNIFIPLGNISATEKPLHVNSYQFFDKQAVEGDNYYRIIQYDNEGNAKPSPVRIVKFSGKAFAVHFTPNPANDYLLVDIQSPVAGSTIKLIDAAGRIVMDEKNENKLLKIRLDVKKLNPGIYTLLVETDQDKFSDKVVITH